MNTEERLDNIEKELANHRRKMKLLTKIAFLALGLAVGSLLGQYFYG